MKFCKKERIIIFLIILFIFSPSLSFGFPNLVGFLYEKKAKTYIDKVVPEIIENWDMDKLKQNAHANFFSATSNENTRQYFFLFKELGPLKEYKGSLGEVVVSKSSAGVRTVTGNYTIEADFEKGSAKVFVGIIKGKNGWGIIGFRAESDLFSKTMASRQELGIENSQGLESIEQLEKYLEPISENDSVQMRRNVDKFFRLAHLYEKEGNDKKALELYEKALQTDPADFESQLRFAKLLLKKGDPVTDRLQYIHRLAEDWDVIEETNGLLTSLNAKPVAVSSSTRVSKKVEVVLVPFDNPNMQVMSELRAALQDRIGVQVIIAGEMMDSGEPDWNRSDQYILDTFTNITKNITELQHRMLVKEVGLTNDKLESPAYQESYIKAYLKKLGREGKIAQKRFKDNVVQMHKEGQYDFTRLVKELHDVFPFDQSRTVKSYIGVTPKDIHSEKSSSQYGISIGSYGMISYFHFTGRRNRERPNRPRLIDRLLKQALSSVNFTFSIPRCSTPYCARAFPHSMNEHDAKSDKLCPVCKERLKAFIQDPRSEESAYEYTLIAKDFLESSKWDKAIEFYLRALKENSNDHSIYDNLGFAYRSIGQYDKAVASYKKTLKLSPDNLYAHLGIGISYASLDSFDKAIEHLEKAKLISENKEALYTYLGISYHNKGRVQEAVEMYEKALEINPELYTLHFNIGMIIEKQQRDKAREHYEKAIKINPSYFKAYIRLGRIYGRAGRVDDAAKSFKTVIELQPDNSIAWNNLGYTYHLRKKFRRAIAHYEKAISSSPDHGLAHYNKAMSHYAIKQFDKAIFHLDKAVEFGYPGSPKFHAALKPHRK